MRILIFSGQHGWIGNMLFKSALPVIRCDAIIARQVKQRMDDRSELADYRFKCKADIDKWIEDEHPTVVINTIAKTNVDACVDFPDDAWLSNAEIPKWIAESCVEHGVKLFVHISTDYVFDKGPDYYKPIDERDQDYNPVNAYGLSKLAGDMAIKRVYDEAKNPDCKARIIRTSSLFGIGKMTFVDLLVSNLRAGVPTLCLSDSFSTPTHSQYLIDYIDSMIVEWCYTKDDVGDDLRYFKNCTHITYKNVSRYEFALDAAQICQSREIANFDPKLIIPSDSSFLTTRRPSWSVLKPDQIFHRAVDYRIDLNRYLMERYCS